MLLDLGRNDVGRVAEIGSVRVTAKMVGRALQPRHAHQSRPSRAASAPASTRSTPCRRLPAGTVSGAPQGRAMEIIESWSRARGFYAGTVGYFAASGSMDTCSRSGRRW
jgi:anthranilate synthase component 1